jgi:hypothetical protein
MSKENPNRFINKTIFKMVMATISMDTGPSERGRILNKLATKLVARYSSSNKCKQGNSCNKLTNNDKDADDEAVGNIGGNTFTFLLNTPILERDVPTDDPEHSIQGLCFSLRALNAMLEASTVPGNKSATALPACPPTAQPLVKVSYPT